MNPNKVDMTLERNQKQWSDLLDTIKRNDDNILNKQEQDWYIEQIEFKLGIRNKNIEILKDIIDSQPDYDDMVG